MSLLHAALSTSVSARMATCWQEQVVVFFNENTPAPSGRIMMQYEWSDCYNAQLKMRFCGCILQEPLPFDSKKHAVVYINTNCNTPSKRVEIMRDLMSSNGSVPVHSLGPCDRDMPGPAEALTKIEVQRQ